MAGQDIIKVSDLNKMLIELGNEQCDDYQVWLSSDEEGNEFLPMSLKPELCLLIKKEAKRIILFPLHR